MISMREAAFDDCMDFAGTVATMRRYLVAMRWMGEAYCLEDEEGPVAMAYIIPHPDGEREFCLGLKPRARVHMRELCRAAQLILKRMAQDGPIICHVTPGNRSGVRMARIVGFEADPDNPYRWTMGGL